MIYETPKPSTPYSKTKAKAMWRRLSTQLHRFAAAANISSTPRSPFRPSTISLSCSVTSNYGTKLDPLTTMRCNTQLPCRMILIYSRTSEFRPTNKLESSGLSLKDIVEQDVKDNPVMLYMKGVPDLPRCGFSSLAVRVLKEYTTGPHFHKYLSRENLSEDQMSFSTCTRTSPAEFIVLFDQYMESVRSNYSVGMRFKMRFEGEEAPEQRFTGTIVGIEDADTKRWGI